MNIKVLFYNFKKEEKLIEGVSETIEIDETSTSLVNAPIWSFKLPEKELERFLKEENLLPGSFTILFIDCKENIINISEKYSQSYTAGAYEIVSSQG